MGHFNAPKPYQQHASCKDTERRIQPELNSGRPLHGHRPFADFLPSGWLLWVCKAWECTCGFSQTTHSQCIGIRFTSLHSSFEKAPAASCSSVLMERRPRKKHASNVARDKVCAYGRLCSTRCGTSLFSRVVIPHCVLRTFLFTFHRTHPRARAFGNSAPRRKLRQYSGLRHQWPRTLLSVCCQEADFGARETKKLGQTAV